MAEQERDGRKTAALHPSEERFGALMEQAPFSIQVFAPDGRTLRVNRAWEELWGTTLEQVADYNVLHDPQLEKKGIASYIRRAFAGEVVEIPVIEYDPNETIPGRTRHPNPRRWVAAVAYPLRDGAGRIREVVLVHEDVTAQRQAEEALRDAHRKLEARVAQRTAELARANQFLQALLENIQDGIVACNAEGVLTLFNRATREFHGLPEQPIPAQQWAEHYDLYRADGQTPMSREEVPLFRALQGERVENAEMVIHPKDGPPRVLLASGQAFHDEHGARLGAVVSMHDVTARKRAEEALRQAHEDLERRVQERTAELARVNEALRESERRWRSLAEVLPNLVWTDLPDGQCDYLSSQWAAYTGIPVEELLGLEWLERVLHPDDRERTRACWLAAVADRGVYDLEYRIRRHDGQYRWFKTRGVPIRDEHGRIVKWFGTCTDIEDHKQGVEELRRSEERFRQLADAMPQIVFTARPDGRIEYLNRRWYEYSGRPEGEISEEGWLDVLHADDRAACIAEAERTNRAGRPFEMELRLREGRSGQYRWHLARSVPVGDGSGQIVRWYGTSTDIHERKRTEDAAHFLADASATLAAVVDYESTLQKVAALAVPYFADWSAVDVASEGGTLRRLAVFHHDADRIQLAQELVRRYPPEPDAPGGIMHVFRTGEPEIITAVSDDMLVKGARDEEHLRMLRALGLRSYICVPLIVSGQTLGVLTFATAESGRGYSQADLALARDLAYRAAVALDNARLYAELRQADRLKDEFLAMLAHELRNPLGPIRNALHILKEPRASGALMQQARDMAERQVQHMARLLDDLLDVSRISRGRIELRKETVDVAAILQRTVEAVRPLLEARLHQLRLALPAGPARVEADPARLEQVLTNLLNNAAKYTDPGGHIGVAVAREGATVVVRVRDNGIGIAADMLPRIFDLFVQAERRLDRSQGGVGIGLTLVKRLVELHGGSVVAHSAGPGQGSEFVVRLPAATGPGGSTKGEGAGASPRGLPQRRVLVVDDNPDAADSLVLLLQLAGQDARAAYDGPAALAAAQTFRPELVFLDIGMPGMDGYEAARRLRQQPGLESIALAALTGWGQQEDRRRSTEAGFDHHLVKPVEPAILHKLLTELPRQS